jgi:outer membrane protein OmpA-like peptidoglycan-associated protein
MFDKDDEGTGIGLWVVIGVITVVLFGLIGGLAIRQMHHKAGAKPAASAAAPAAQAASAASADAEALLDTPISGDLAATLFFASASAALPEGAAAEIAKVQAALAAAPARKVVLSGFHDASGDPAKNAELAKERAKAVRDGLKSAGVDAARIALRKPEVTTGDGNSQEARRVEIRLVD